LTLLLICWLGCGSSTVGIDEQTATVSDSDSSASVERVPGVSADLADAFFDVDQVHTIELFMTDAAWLDIRDNAYAENWHEATFVWGDERVESVGVRAFGNSSLTLTKPPLKIAFDRHVEGQRWRGLEQLKLDNARTDPSFLTERLSTAMFRRAGIPAARTGWAQVLVNDEPVGFYISLESVDDRFLQRWFGNDDGPLWSINDIRGHGLLPLSDPLVYFKTETSVTSLGDDLVDLTRIVSYGSDDELAEVLDLEAFFVESVIRSLQGSFDSFSSCGNNFYLYNDPGQDADPDDLHGTWRVIPWDFDLDMGVWYGVESAVMDPWAPWVTSKNADGVYYDGADYWDPIHIRNQEMGRDVGALLAELAAGPLAWATLDQEIRDTYALIEPYVQEDPLGHGPGLWDAIADLRMLLHLMLANQVGEVSECASFADNALGVGELSPAGKVGASVLVVDGWSWGAGELNCVLTDRACVGLDVGQEHFCTGLYAHAPSDITIQVPDGYRVLRGGVGLQVHHEDDGDGAAFEVWQAGEMLWASEWLTNYDPVQDLEVTVAPGELRLVTDMGQNAVGDATTWTDLRVEAL
jgi:hypothetical protein